VDPVDPDSDPEHCLEELLQICDAEDGFLLPAVDVTNHGIKAWRKKAYFFITGIRTYMYMYMYSSISTTQLKPSHKVP